MKRRVCKPIRRARACAIASLLVLTGVLFALALCPSEKTATVFSAIHHIPVSALEDRRAECLALNDEEDARAYFLRLLNCPYVMARGERLKPMVRVDEQWFGCEENDDGTRVSAVFTTEGVITSFGNAGVMSGKLVNTEEPSMLKRDDLSVTDFVRGFVYEYLPGIAFDSIRIVADRYNQNGRYITCHTANRYTETAHVFIVQVEPTAQILRFELMDDESKTVQREFTKRSPNPKPTPLRF